MKKNSPRTPPKIEIIKTEPNSISIPNHRKRDGLSLAVPNSSELGSLSCQNSPDQKPNLLISPKTPNVYRNNSFQCGEDDTKQKNIRAYSFASKKSLDLGSSKSLTTINERLEVIKKQTDDDCKFFEKELTEFKKPAKDHQNFQFCMSIESQLSIFSQKIQKTSINDLKDGQYRVIMDELTKLNRTTELTKNVDEYVKESRKMIRKLIFIFSRCARILELLRQSQIQTKQKMENKYEKQEKQEPKSTLGAILSKFGFGTKETNSPKEQIQSLVCRICEEPFPSKEFESHSKLCQSRQNVELKENQIEEKIKKITSYIKKDLKSRKEDGFESEILNGLLTIAKTANDLPFDKSGFQDIQLLIDDVKEIQKTNCKDKEIITLLTKLEQYLINKMEIIIERLKVGGESKPKRKIKITDFDILKNVGAGAYGRVFLARKKNTRDLFAIKVLKKEEINKKKQYKRILAERNIMALTSNNFVVKMYYSFQGKEYLYIVMEYLRGGDLHSLLKKEGYFEENIVRQYTAEIVLALEYIHSLKIVHRDLKPDNILIGNDGHIKLTDFGLSEIGLYQSDFFLDDIIQDKDNKSPNTPLQQEEDNLEIFGTPDYLAPELLLGIEHSFGVDLWALGVLIFELLTGCPPFNDQSPEDIFDNILSLDIPWPEEGLLPESGIDLIKKLLVLDPKERLNIQQVKNHKFFSNVNWKNILNQKPEYIPQLDDEDLMTLNMDEFKNDDESRSLQRDSFLSVSPKQHLGFSFINTSNLAKKNEEEMNKSENKN